MRAARSPAAPGRVFCSDRRLLQIWGREGRGPERLKEGARTNQLQASKHTYAVHIPCRRLGWQFHFALPWLESCLLWSLSHTLHIRTLVFLSRWVIRHDTQKARRSPDSLPSGCLNGSHGTIARIGRPRGLVLNLWLGKWPAPGPLKIPRSQLGGTSHRAALCHMPLNRMSLS